MWPFKKGHKHQLIVAAHRTSPTAWIGKDKALCYGTAYFERLECIHPACGLKEWRFCKCPAVTKAAKKKGARIKAT